MWALLETGVIEAGFQSRQSGQIWPPSRIQASEVHVCGVADGVHRPVAGQLIPLDTLTSVPPCEGPPRARGAIRFMSGSCGDQRRYRRRRTLLPGLVLESWHFLLRAYRWLPSAPAGLVPLVWCWINHCAVGSSLPLVFHRSSEILGQEKASIRGLRIGLGKARLGGPFPELTWPLERLIAAGIALPAQASMAHLYSLVPAGTWRWGVAR